MNRIDKELHSSTTFTSNIFAVHDSAHAHTMCFNTVLYYYKHNTLPYIASYSLVNSVLCCQETEHGYWTFCYIQRFLSMFKPPLRLISCGTIMFMITQSFSCFLNSLQRDRSPLRRSDHVYCSCFEDICILTTRHTMEDTPYRWKNRNHWNKHADGGKGGEWAGDKSAYTEELD